MPLRFRPLSACTQADGWGNWFVVAGDVREPTLFWEAAYSALISLNDFEPRLLVAGPT